MLKDNWEGKHGMDLPIHTTCSKGIQGTRMGNIESSLTSSGSASDCSIPHQSNLQDNVRSENEAHKSLIGSNMQELVKFLTANYGPMKTPLEVGTPEYSRLAEILQQSTVQLNGFSQEEFREHKEKVIANNKINDSVISSRTKDKKKLISVKAPEKLWEGSLQLSSSVTLSAVAFFKSGEKLLAKNWPESIEVKGKVKLEAFEKYVQDLPRSRNRGLMVISLCWKEGSSESGLTGMKEVSNGYKKSCRVGFAQLLPGTDIYICPRSDPVITILAKYGFFKGMAVVDDKPDSMIGCVVWRKIRSSYTKTTPKPQGSSTIKQKTLSPEKQLPEPVTLPTTANCESSNKNIASVEVEVDHNNLGNSSSNNSSPMRSSDNLVTKRAFEDDDLPEFDFGKSTRVNGQKVDNTRLTQLPTIVNTFGLLDQSSKKIKLFDDDDDDIPEWCPPELHKKLPPLPPPQPLLPPIPPPPLPDTRPLFSYQPFRPPTFVRAPPLPPLPLQPLLLQPPPPQPLPPRFLGGFNSNQALWVRPGSSNVNPSFMSFNRRYP